MVTYDESKRRANLAKHGIDFAALTNYFDGDRLTRQETQAAYAEFKALGGMLGKCYLLSGRRTTTNGPILFRHGR